MKPGQTSLIDWQQLVLNLRRYKPLAHVANEVDIDADTLRRIARGETPQPKFDQGLRLLNLHLDHCSDRHRDILNRQTL